MPNIGQDGSIHLAVGVSSRRALFLAMCHNSFSEKALLNHDLFGLPIDLETGVSRWQLP